MNGIPYKRRFGFGPYLLVGGPAWSAGLPDVGAREVP
jgi:hypothetical protein